MDQDREDKGLDRGLLSPSLVLPLSIKNNNAKKNNYISFNYGKFFMHCYSSILPIMFSNLGAPLDIRFCLHR